VLPVIKKAYAHRPREIYDHNPVKTPVAEARIDARTRKGIGQICAM
jgi:hypothetical protein